MRDLRGTCQRKLELGGQSWTDPMNSDMAVRCGYQNSDKERERLRWRGKGKAMLWRRWAGVEE